jgi:elongation factor Ts
MAISAKEVKALREATGAGMMDCKKALTEADGNVDKAVELLRKKGMAAAAKRAGRATGEGLVQSYIHGNGKIGVLIEINCETDFVAKTDDFAELAKDLCMQIAAVAPKYVSREFVPEDVVNKEIEIYKEQALASGKPEKIVDKIAEGKLEKFYSEVCLVDMPYVKEDKKKVSERVKDAVAKLGENISVARFVRFQVGQ